MADGRTYDHASETYSYWADPMGRVNVSSEDYAQGGIVFLLPREVAPRRIVYRGGLFESEVEIDLNDRPSSTDN